MEAARRRAEAARQAAIGSAASAGRRMRNEFQANIAKDSTVGEDMEVRNAAIARWAIMPAQVVVMDPKSGRVYTSSTRNGAAAWIQAVPDD